MSSQQASTDGPSRARISSPLAMSHVVSIYATKKGDPTWQREILTGTPGPSDQRRIGPPLGPLPVFAFQSPADGGVGGRGAGTRRAVQGGGLRLAITAIVRIAYTGGENGAM